MEDQYKQSLNKRYCLSALSLGLKYYPQVYPNPPVGAIVVKHGKLLAKGAHQRAGLAHAEVNAINNAGASARGADLYVSLEPCNHFGKTPPCTNLILEAGIKTVHYMMADNTEAQGGADYLRDKGVEVYNIEPPLEVIKYLEAWKLYALEGKVSLTPIFFLDLAGNFTEVTCPALIKKISKRYQKIVDKNTPLADLKAYDVAYLIQSKKEIDNFIDMKTDDKVKVSKIVIARTINYKQNLSMNTPELFLDLFGNLELQWVQIFKNVCLEGYSVAHV